MKNTFYFLLSVFLLVGLAVNAALVPIAGVSASNGGDRYANGPISIINGSGIDKTADPSDPSQWVNSGGDYKDELMSWYFPSPAINSKLAWISLDAGSSQDLGDLWLFNNNYGGGVSGINTYNLYTAVSPTVALPAMPNKNTFSSTGLTPAGDYDFASGGWTQFNTSGVLTVPKSGSTSVDLTGITAQYIGIEILTNYGDTYKGGRVGLDEVALMISDIPEPSTAILGFLGLMGLGFSRRK